MSPDRLEALPDLPNRLRAQAKNVEDGGWLTAARLMRHAADLLEGVPAKECPECPKYLGKCPYCHSPRPRPWEAA